jgi:retron-type reverse transcriptase
MSCRYANLRIMSDYPGIIWKISNEQRESMCPFNELSPNKASVPMRIKPFINYSDRAKHKIERRFFSVRDESEDLTFSRKFCRKTTIDVQSEIKYWIEKNAQLEKELWTLYSNPSTKNGVFEIKNINRIRRLLKDYNYVQSLQVTEVLSILKTRIVQKNLPHSIERLQCILVESFCISVLAVLEISKSNEAKTPGVDGKCFSTLNRKRDEYRLRQLKGTRYHMSGKSFKIKKDLPNKAIIFDNLNETLKTQLTNETTNFRFKLLKQCNLKTIMKNYKGSSVRRVWVPKKDVNKYRPLGIPTIRNRILQQIITWAILPISESQADSLSFGFRPGRSATQAVAYILRKLSKSRITRNRDMYSPRKVSEERFNIFKGKKSKFRSFKTFKDGSKNKRHISYHHDYWIYPSKIRKCQPFRFHSQYRYLNVDVVKCFDQINHNTIYQKIPLASKYLFFIKTWCTSKIIGPESSGGKNIELKPTSGIPQGSIIGPPICNIVLDGLQDFIQENLPTRYTRSPEELGYIKFKSLGKLSRSVSRAYIQLFCIRYADDILILAKCLKVHMKKIQELLVTFLNKISLSIKSPSIFQGRLFKPGSSFEYLGFKFIYPHLNKPNFDKGKFTKVKYTPMSVATGEATRYSRSGPYLLVQNRSFDNIKTKLKTQLNAINSYVPPDVMIDKLNSILRGALNYYNLTGTITKQLLPLNDLLHRFFYKYLLRRYSSKPKIYTFIRKNFRKDKRFSAENKVLLRVTDVKPLNSVALIFIAPGNSVLNANIYLDKNIIDEKTESNLALQKTAKLSYGRKLSIQETIILLHEYQKSICKHCLKNIDLENEQTELDHFPSISQLKLDAWNRINEIPSIEINMTSIIRSAHTTVEYRLLHKHCNQLLGKTSQEIMAQRSKEYKKKYSKEHYERFLSFSRDFTTRIKRIRVINQKQTDAILRQVGFV